MENFDYQESDATNKLEGSSPQNCTKSPIFYTEFMMGELELLVAQEDKFENGAKEEKVAQIGNFELSRHPFKNSNQQFFYRKPL